ncbi:MAG: prephenate dehydrogenase/arogenate dehydrogenase family protein [Candidatus Methanomethylophilaceae archaeon]|nr:prephenate dehydrogenase/arogenate dehydrogenase family protein [Candidatus Methanomethylophilaceae archaeon]
MGLDELREGIGRIDAEIVGLIAERTELAKKVGEIKRERNLPIRNESVERKVVSRYVEAGMQAGLSREAMENVARALIKEAVEVESRVPSGRVGKKIAIIGGAGKMGVWTADFLSDSGHEVIAIDPALDNGLSIEDCAGCDAVIISVPIHSVAGILGQLKGICSPDTLIFDLASLKTPAEPALREMAKSMKVCSVHPMFGPSATSMYGRNLIVCDCGNREAAEEAADLFSDSGGNIRVMGLSEHDSYMSYVLGLTHAVNIALFTVLQRSGYSFEDLRTVSSTTFNKGLDTNMSVASEDPMLYYEIQHMNSHREEMWSLFAGAVEDLRECSLSDDPSGFVSLMDAGREYFYGKR